jgi:hypothetical protein
MAYGVSLSACLTLGHLGQENLNFVCQVKKETAEFEGVNPLYGLTLQIDCATS